MVRTRAGRRTGLAAAVLLLSVSAGACSSGSATPEPTPGPRQHQVAARSIDSVPLLAQCVFRSGAGGVLASAKQVSKDLPASQQWLQGSQLVLTKANASQFDGWFQAHAAGVVVGGRTLDSWEEYAGQNDKLPVAVCGTGVSPRALHDQIYAQYPSMKKNNPWGA